MLSTQQNVTKIPLEVEKPTATSSPMPEGNFWRYVDRGTDDGCWVWRGGFQGKYGVATSGNGEKKYAHRLSYELNKGMIPDGQLVCHKCDNPACVNPKHLFLGTIADNNRDKTAKGRNVAPLGRKNGASKLSEEQVLAIRNDSRTRKEIHTEYGISPSTVYAIKTGRYWSHLKGENDVAS